MMVSLIRVHPAPVERKAPTAGKCVCGCEIRGSAARVHEERPELFFLVAHALVRDGGENHIRRGAHDARERLDLAQKSASRSSAAAPLVAAPPRHRAVAEEGENFWKMLRLAVHEDGARIKPSRPEQRGR